MNDKTVTFNEMLEAVRQHRPCSPKSLRRYIKQLGIRPPAKLRVKPYRYSQGSIIIVLDALGEKVVTMSQLRAVKRQAQKARAL